MLESKLQRDIRLHLGQKPDLIIWRQNVGKVHDSRSDNWVHVGLCVGSSDLIGIVSVPQESDGFVIECLGRFFAAEIKGPHGTVSKEQQAFLDLVNKAGGYGCILRSVAEAEAHYQRARQGLDAPGPAK